MSRKEKEKRMKINKCKYPKLDGKITEVFGTRKAFAEALDVTPTTLGNKMNGKTPWKQKEIEKTCVLCDIPRAEIGNYFLP